MRVVFDINVYIKNIFDEQATWPDIEPLPPASENAAADCLSIAFDGLGIELFVSPHIMENIFRLMAHAGHTDAFIETYIEALLDIVEQAHRVRDRQPAAAFLAPAAVTPAAVSIA